MYIFPILSDWSISDRNLTTRGLKIHVTCQEKVSQLGYWTYGSY